MIQTPKVGMLQIDTFTPSLLSDPVDFQHLLPKLVP